MSRTIEKTMIVAKFATIQPNSDISVSPFINVCF